MKGFIVYLKSINQKDIKDIAQINKERNDYSSKCTGRIEERWIICE